MTRAGKAMLLIGAGAAVLVVGGILLFGPGTCGTSPGSSPTRQTFQGLESALASFRSDWGRYPPSRYTDEPYDLEPYGGAGLMAYYLMGPTGSGWGGEIVQIAPFGGTVGRPYGPYHPFDLKYLRTEDTRPVGVLDSLKPPKPILYFLAQSDREPRFGVRDNPVDPTGEKGFASQGHFEMLVRRAGPDGKVDWVKAGYLLISPGPDRLYGYIVGDAKTARSRPARPEEMGSAVCDDVTNFAY
jgi:hypothetical protein